MLKSAEFNYDYLFVMLLLLKWVLENVRVLRRYHLYSFSQSVIFEFSK